eukprot:9532221-Karenia_brevis.AAC.1
MCIRDSFKIDDLAFFCSKCHRPQSRRHFCNPVLKQSKDPEYADAVYHHVLSPGRWRTCNNTQEQQ